MGKTDTAVMRAEFAEILPAVERWHAMAVRHSRIAIWCAACCGHELIGCKKAIGHGGWMKFLKVLPFGDDTARKYMDLAVEWKERTGQIPITIGISQQSGTALLSGDSKTFDLNDSQFREIVEHTQQAVGETTLRQLYFDWGICKPPHRPGGNVRKGGAEPRGALTQEEIYAACAGAWVRIVEDLTEHGRRQKTHIHLTDGEIEAHREGLKRVVEELEAELARRAKGKKA